MPDFQCAVASSARGEPIFATASQVRRWLLVEVRGSWGRDAVANTDLGRHIDDRWRAARRAAGIRVVAIRRDLERTPDRPLRLFYVESSPPIRAAWRLDVAGLHAVGAATDALPHVDAGSGWTRHRDPLVLVCTNGKHDACCATFGRPVIRALRAAGDSEALWECSHIGGDRFAGNVVVLPDGLYFGRCTPESASAVIDAYRAGSIDLDHYRGRSTLGYMHQAAEYFTRRELDLTSIDAVAAVRRVGDPADGRFDVVIGDGGVAAVTVRRVVEPAQSPLTCTGPGGVGLPRYELVQFDVRSSASR